MIVSGTVTQTYSGENIDTFWPNFKESLEGIIDPQSGITLRSNDANHSLNFTLNNYLQTLDEDDIAAVLNEYQINQNGTKLRRQVLAQGYWQPYDIDTIFTKQ
jgi:hypothetical protein